MKILLDEMYTGLKDYFDFMGWEVSSVKDEGIEGSNDKEVVKYAMENDFLLVTEDQKPADLADLKDVPYILISKKDIASLINSKIEEKY